MYCYALKPARHKTVVLSYRLLCMLLPYWQHAKAAAQNSPNQGIEKLTSGCAGAQRTDTDKPLAQSTSKMMP
jgi:hypothetical protein